MFFLVKSYLHRQNSSLTAASEGSECIFSTVCHVQEAVLIFVFLINGGHHCSCGRKDIFHKDKNSLLSAKLYSLTNDIHKLPHSQISRNQVLFLVNVRNVTSFSLLHNNRYSIRVLLPDTSSFSLPPLWNNAPPKLTIREHNLD